MTKEESKHISEDNEQQFQEVYTQWYNTGRREYWHKMFYCVQFCCENIMKSKLKGVVCPDFEGKVLDTTLDIMEKILKGTRPEKLSSYCYLYCIHALYDKNTALNERAISYENWIEYGDE